MTSLSASADCPELAAGSWMHVVSLDHNKSLLARGQVDVQGVYMCSCCVQGVQHSSPHITTRRMPPSLPMQQTTLAYACTQQHQKTAKVTQCTNAEAY